MPDELLPDNPAHNVSVALANAVLDQLHQWVPLKARLVLLYDLYAICKAGLEAYDREKKPALPAASPN